MGAFSETRIMFAEAISYEKPLTFDQWMRLAPVPRVSRKDGSVKYSEDHRAAALFVQFYEQITLAWYKVRSYYTLEEDGVSTVIQYLQKNVPIIAANPKRFSPHYIYQVAFNCLYCICHDIQIDRERFARETSNIHLTDNGEVDLFDTVAESDVLESEIARKAFWKLIYDALTEEATYSRKVIKGGEVVVERYSEKFVDGRAEAVINKLLGGSSGMVANFCDETRTRTTFGPRTEKDSERPRCRVSKDVESAVIEKIRAALINAGFGY